MPVKIKGKTYKNHESAAKAAAKAGIKNPDAYVATIERNIKKGRKK